MIDNSREIRNGPRYEPAAIDEGVWKAWVEKGVNQDRVRRQRVKAIVYVLVILISCVIFWLFVRSKVEDFGR